MKTRKQTPQIIKLIRHLGNSNVAPFLAKYFYDNGYKTDKQFQALVKEFPISDAIAIGISNAYRSHELGLESFDKIPNIFTVKDIK